MHRTNNFAYWLNRGRRQHSAETANLWILQPGNWLRTRNHQLARKISIWHARICIIIAYHKPMLHRQSTLCVVASFVQWSKIYLQTKVVFELNNCMKCNIQYHKPAVMTARAKNNPLKIPPALGSCFGSCLWTGGAPGLLLGETNVLTLLGGVDICEKTRKRWHLWKNKVKKIERSANKHRKQNIFLRSTCN
jgi:hypothetical protein